MPSTEKASTLVTFGDSVMKLSLHLVATLLVASILAGCGGGSGNGNSNGGQTDVVSFTSTPPLVAGEGQSYSYIASAQNSGRSSIVYQLTSAPAGAVFSGSTVSWTPATSQSRVSNSFVLLATAGTSTARQNWSVTPSGSVRGTDIVTYRAALETAQLPEDMSQFPPVAFAPDGNGGFTTLQGTGSADGTFSVAGVPGGSYWLQFDAQTFICTSSSSVDIGYDGNGRADTAWPSAPTFLDLDLTGLNPWQSGDRQQVYVANTDTWQDYDWSAMGLRSGVTTLDEQLPWAAPLLDSSRGDRMYLTQLVTTPALPGLPIQVAQRSLGPLSVTQVDGAEMEIEGDLQVPATSGSLRPVISGSAFAGLESGMNPSAIPDSSYFYLDVHPSGTTLGWVANTPDLVALDGTGNPIRSDVDLGNIAFGNPFPATWGTFYDYAHYVWVDYTAAGAVNSTGANAILEVQDATVPTAAQPISPAVGPVGSPLVEGISLFSDQTVSTTSPTISWTAPALGSATGYEVDIYSLYVIGVDSTFDLVGTLLTASTSAQIPPGVLQDGASYFFCITAVAEPGQSFATAPFRHSFPRGAAQTLSGVITVNASGNASVRIAKSMPMTKPLRVRRPAGHRSKIGPAGNLRRRIRTLTR